jgi:hypothetical protein
MGEEWMSEVEFRDVVPDGVGTQAYSFTNPMGESLYYTMEPDKTNRLTFGVLGLIGVIVGSFLYALVSRKFRFEWFSSVKDFFAHATGGALMGIGGILAMGCTIGQGVTGFSTLAVGSIMAFASFIFGSALTMKVQYYKMVYENEASYFGAFVTALVDMRLLPGGLRRLEAV